MQHLTLPEISRLAERLAAADARHGVHRETAAPPVPTVAIDAYPDVWQQGAALMASIARESAPDADAKRLAWNATWVFLQLNGHWLDAAFDIEAAERLVGDCCRGTLDVAIIAECLRRFEV